MNVDANSQLDRAELEERPFQFGLRTALLAVGACGVLFAVMSHVGLVWSTVLAWSGLLVAAHMVANAWGTRAKSRRRQRHPADDELPEETWTQQPIEFAPTTQLGDNRRLGMAMFILTGVGALVGLALGTLTLLTIYWDELSYLGILVGGLSAAVIGGFLGFLTSTFLGVSLRAWNEASGSGAKGGRIKEKG